MAITNIAERPNARQEIARDTLNLIALALTEPEAKVPVVSILSQSLEAARDLLPAELHYTIDRILDGCAQAERRD